MSGILGWEIVAGETKATAKAKGWPSAERCRLRRGFLAQLKLCPSGMLGCGAGLAERHRKRRATARIDAGPSLRPG